jgi:hypothetical protein
MDLQGLRDALKRQPFEPFTIRLSDGRSLPVEHPDFVAVGSIRAIVIARDDSWSVIEPLLIVSLDYEAPKKGDNGRAKRKRTD